MKVCARPDPGGHGSLSPMTKSLRFLLLLPCIAAIGAEARATNQLGSEPSAFLKSFASSPVNWMPWGEAAIARAKAEQKPVFVFVGSFTSELAGAMRRQTFANAKSSDWLNKNFVCVIVDRDERPDVAAQYEGFVGSLKQMTGWPLNVWLTPDFQPYEGATYLSPSEDWGAPGFLKLANEALSAWKTNPASCRKRATDSIAQMAPIPSSPAGPWNPDKLRSRLATDAAAWRATFDPVQGGFGDVPRGLEPELVRFMLLQSADDKVAAQKTLRAIAASAVRDPLDGGFFRHASDGAWHIPYQQKTVTDQARVALAFLAGAEGPDAASFGECARGALDYALTRLSHPDGTLASSSTSPATSKRPTGSSTPSPATSSSPRTGRCVDLRVRRPPPTPTTMRRSPSGAAGWRGLQRTTRPWSFQASSCSSSTRGSTTRPAAVTLGPGRRQARDSS